MVSPRNKVGFLLAIIGGAFLVVGGGMGMVDLLEDIEKIVEDKISDNSTISSIFKILVLLAALGGIAVIIGGFFIYLEFPLIAKILITLGAGIGIVGLLIGIGMAWYSGDAGQYFNGLLASLAGIGIVLSIAASMIAK